MNPEMNPGSDVQINPDPDFQHNYVQNVYAAQKSRLLFGKFRILFQKSGFSIKHTMYYTASENFQVGQRTKNPGLHYFDPDSFRNQTKEGIMILGM